MDEEHAPIGVRLREARMRQGLDLSDCAAATRIRERYLIAIEDGRFESLPGPAYVSGFIRAYAAHLGVAVDGPEKELPVPGQVPRFVRLPEGPKGQIRFLPLEALLEVFLGKLFPGYAMLGHCAFRVLRDSDLEVEEEAEDLVREFETALKRRRRGEVIQLTMTSQAPADLRRKIVQSLGIADEEVIELPGLIGIADLAELTRAGRPDLLWRPFTPRDCSTAT